MKYRILRPVIDFLAFWFTHVIEKLAYYAFFIIILEKSSENLFHFSFLTKLKNF